MGPALQPHDWVSLAIFIIFSAHRRVPTSTLRDFRPQRRPRPLENYASGQRNNEWPAAGKIHALPLAVANGRQRVASAAAQCSSGGNEASSSSSNHHIGTITTAASTSTDRPRPTSPHYPTPLTLGRRPRLPSPRSQPGSPDLSLLTRLPLLTTTPAAAIAC